MTPKEHAQRLLALGVDIAQLRGTDDRYASPEAQIFRVSPENVGQTAAADTAPVEGQIRPGSSPNLRSSDFVDSYFNNLPFLLRRTDTGGLERDAQGRLLGTNLDQPAREGGTVLDLWAGEALAIFERAMRGEASPDELKLLDAYNEFFAGRTGM
jgi:hypothetical protein